MLNNIKHLYLHCVFHGIRFKVSNEDWLSGDNLFFFIYLTESFSAFLPFNSEIILLLYSDYKIYVVWIQK